MEKSEIGREVIKYNFLKKIIIRFDYNGMDDTELDQVISGISREVKEHGYIDRTIETADEIGIRSFSTPYTTKYTEKKEQKKSAFVSDYEVKRSS